MANSIVIGNIERTGFIDTSFAGQNSQVRTYRNGNAFWTTVPTQTADVQYDRIITSIVTSDAMLNHDGNEMTFDLTTYIGIDSVPNRESLSEDAQFYGFRLINGVLFLDTFISSDNDMVDSSVYLDWDIAPTGVTYSTVPDGTKINLVITV